MRLQAKRFRALTRQQVAPNASFRPLTRLPSLIYGAFAIVLYCRPRPYSLILEALN